MAEINTISTQDSYTYNRLKKRIQWGALWGLFLSMDAILFYTFFAATSSNGFSKEIEKISFIPKSAIPDLTSRILLSGAIYTSSTSLFFALANVIKKSFQDKQLPTTLLSGEDIARNKKHNDDIKRSFNLISQQKQLDFSRKQNLLGLMGFGSFLFFNIVYDYAYKDASSVATQLLPTYGLPLYENLKSETGMIGFLMNLFLNQWFCFSVLRSMINQFNTLHFVRKYHHKKTGKASISYTIKNVIGVLFCSVVASIPFFFLALNDPKADRSDFLKLMTPLSSFIVYGTVLNIEGASSLINDTKHLFRWLNTTPQPFINLHQRLKHHRFYLVGYLFHNLIEFTKELAYYFGLNKAYLEHNDFLNRQSDCLLSAQQIRRPYPSLNEIEAAVAFSIQNSNGSSLGDLSALIIEEQDRLISQRNGPANSKALWVYGRVRQACLNTASLLGAAGISVVLLGYYFLINKELTHRIYNPLFNMTEESAAAHMLSFIVFSPFIKLALDSASTTMQRIFLSTETLMTRIYHSAQCLLRRRSSHDFDYSKRFHPIHKKEMIPWLLDVSALSLISFTFVIAPLSAGTAMYLLKKRGLLNTTTQTMAFWATGLFNVFGISNFLSWVKTKAIHCFSLSAEQKQALSQNHQWFEWFEKAPQYGLLFDLKDLAENNRIDLPQDPENHFSC